MNVRSRYVNSKALFSVEVVVDGLEAEVVSLFLDHLLVIHYVRSFEVPC